MSGLYLVTLGIMFLIFEMMNTMFPQWLGRLIIRRQCFLLALHNHLFTANCAVSSTFTSIITNHTVIQHRIVLIII